MVLCPQRTCDHLGAARAETRVQLLATAGRVRAHGVKAVSTIAQQRTTAQPRHDRQRTIAQQGRQTRRTAPHTGQLTGSAASPSSLLVTRSTFPSCTNCGDSKARMAGTRVTFRAVERASTGVARHPTLTQCIVTDFAAASSKLSGIPSCAHTARGTTDVRRVAARHTTTRHHGTPHSTVTVPVRLCTCVQRWQTRLHRGDSPAAQASRALVPLAAACASRTR